MTPNVLIYEYISGGGWPHHELPTMLMAEGLAMLRAILADFRAWGKVTVTTTRDRRLAGVLLPADRIIDVDPSVHDTTLSKLAGGCTAALIIAPESNGILKRLSILMERQGVHLLGSSPAGIAMTADKWVCYQLFHQAGLATPPTWRVSVSEAEETAEKIGFPLVIKPLDGVGCEGVSLVRNTASLLAALKDYNYTKSRLLLQRYIEGWHVSASLLISENNITCLSLNKQAIETGGSFSYHGGEVPFICDKHEKAVNSAKRAAELIPGLNGYIGVDMVINTMGCHLIEINPRLTTSYIGLRQVVNINLAEAIWRASTEGFLPQNISLMGKAIFKKEDLA